MILSFFLIGFGLYIFFKHVVFRKQTPIISNNKYIENHTKKLKDDQDYEDYIEWCKIKGEMPTEKEGFDIYRMREYQMYKKLIKFGIKGFK